MINRTAVITFIAVLGLAAVAQAQKFTTLYDFTGGSDGAYPCGGLVLDATGNLYGSTQKDGPNGTGTLFKLTPSDKETAVLGFGYAPSGAFPPAALVFSTKGNLYGTTTNGGTFNGGNVVRGDAVGEGEDSL